MFIGQRRMTSFHTITTYKHTMSAGWQSDLPPFKKKPAHFNLFTFMVDYLIQEKAPVYLEYTIAC